MESAELEANDLLDLAAHISTDASRARLQYIYADPAGQLVATNGHTMLVIANAHTFTRPALLPVDKDVLALGRKAKGWLVTVALDQDNDEITMEAAGIRINRGWPGYDAADYPNWRNVIPAAHTVTPIPAIGLDLDKLARFSRVGYRKGDFGGYTQLHFTDPHRAVLLTFKNAPNRLGIIMPIRTAEEAFGPLGQIVAAARSEVPAYAGVTP